MKLSETTKRPDEAKKHSIERKIEGPKLKVCMKIYSRFFSGEKIFVKGSKIELSLCGVGKRESDE